LHRSESTSSHFRFHETRYRGADPAQLPKSRLEDADRPRGCHPVAVKKDHFLTIGATPKKPLIGVQT